MPTTKRRLSLLTIIVLLLAACAPESTTTGSTNPATPAPSQVAATQTLPPRTEMPGPPKPVTTPEAVTFSPLEVKIVDLSEASVVIDGTGWPTVVMMPEEGYMTVALRCDGGMEMMFVETDPQIQHDIEVSCASSAELLVIVPLDSGPFYLIGVGETVAESHTQQGGLVIHRWIFKSGTENRLVDWSSKS